jgi:diamine N-acetyltransferase
MEDHQIHVRPLNRFNWELAIELQPGEDQQDLMPSVLHTIAQSKFEDVSLNGVFWEDELVGFVSWGKFGRVCWINRILIDHAHQRKGFAKEALKLVLMKLMKDPSYDEIRTSFVRRNAVAEVLFASLGFVRIADGLDDEVVMTYRP